MKLASLLLALALLASCQGEQDFLAKGDGFLAKNSFADAEIQYRRALQKEPNSARAQAKLGQALQKQGKLRDALGAYLTATQIEPANQNYQRELVDLLLDVFLASARRPKAIYDQLLATSKNITAQDPQAFEALRVQGILALVEGRFPEAIPVLRQALDQRPGNLQVALALVEALYFNKQIPEAESLASSLISRNPDSREAYDRLYGIYLGTDRKAEALAVLERKAARLSRSSAAVLQLARHYYVRENNPAKGQEQLNRLLDNPQQYPDGTLAAAVFILESGQPDRAAAALEKGIARQDPSLAEMHKLLAECYQRLNQRPKALEQLRLAAKLSPEDDSIQLAEAILEVDELKRESVESALARLNKLREAGVASARADYQRGRALLLLGKDKEGLQALQESIARQRSLLEPRFALAAYALNRGKPNDALRELDQIDVLAPENERAVLYRAQALRLAQRNDEARSLLRQAAKLFPANPELTQEEALLQLESGRFAEALANFESLYRQGLTGSAVIAGIVQCRRALQQAPAALAFLEKEIAANPASAELKILRADLYTQAANFPAAIAAYESIQVPAGPTQTLVKSNLAALYLRMRNLDKATAAYRELIALHPDKAAAYSSWLSAALATGQGAQVADACRAWIDSSPTPHWTALNNCAYGLAVTKGDLELAEAYTQRALQLEPQQPNLQDTLGFVRIQQRRFTEAVKIYASLCEQQPANGSFRYHYGLASAGAGQKVAAKGHFEQALRNQPPAELEKSIRQALAQL